MQVDMLDRYDWLSPPQEGSTGVIDSLPFDVMHGNYSGMQQWQTASTDFTDPDQIDWFTATGILQQQESFPGPFG
jgi:hypothetical protein